MQKNKMTSIRSTPAIIQPAEGRRRIFIDPSYDFFGSNGLFNLNDPVLNRDDQLLPFHRMRQHMAGEGISVNTADFLFEIGDQDPRLSEYYSLGILDNYERVLSEKLAHLTAFVIMEPPVVAPQLYQALPRLSEVFDRVYLHNTTGDGYSLQGVDSTKLRRLYWPIPYNHVLEPYWETGDRMKRIVVINGSHNPHGRSREQYSLRIQAMASLAKLGIVDLFGRGWKRWWSRSAMWLPYWRNRRVLMSIYKGPCASKFEVLARYQFCLCFENMSMEGYITEKIFDCFYAGVIPLYRGAPDITKYVPAGAFVDCRKYPTWESMWEEITAIPPAAMEAMRFAGRQFLQSDSANLFYDSMQNLCTG